MPLQTERENFRSQIEDRKTNLTPSREYAWILGALASGGYVDFVGRRISIDSKDEGFLNKFKSVGEQVFGVDGRITSKAQENGHFKRVVFYGSEMVSLLGDLRRPNWISTIHEKHEWIVDSEEYMWGFLEGVFDRVGFVGSVGRKRRLGFHTVYSDIANSYIDLLSRVGVDRPTLAYYPKKRGGGIKGVKIDNIRDIKLVARNIRSKIPKKEQVLEVYRGLDENKARRLRRQPVLGEIPQIELQQLNAEDIEREEIEPGIEPISKTFPEEDFDRSNAEDIEINEIEPGVAPTLVRLSKMRRLINFVREEIGMFKRGEIPYVSSNTELGRRFGYGSKSKLSIHRYLIKEGLAEERPLLPRKPRLRKETKSELFLTPSRDLAWMLGVLVSRGYCSPMDDIISVDSVDERFLKTFKSIGERLLRVNARERRVKSVQGSDEKLGISFYSKRSALALGDLRRTVWHNTILEKHGWILAEQEYTWGFIEGVFDRVGYVKFPKDSKGREIGFNSKDMAMFIADLLASVGVRRPSVARDSLKRGRDIKGIAICNLDDIKLISNNIHSNIVEKEKRLQIYRKMTRKRLSPSEIYAEAIEEWRRLRKILVNITSEEIVRLKREGKTRYSVGVYTRKFGKSDGQSSFIIARERLEGIIQEEEQGGSKEELHIPKETQIFP